ncbi:PIR protein, partial [Plasmodium ovale]
MSTQSEYTQILKFFGHSSKELFSERFYDALKNDYFELYKYNQICQGIYGNKKISEMKKLCKKVLKYLEKSSAWKENKSGFDDCILLNFWVYDELTKYFAHDTSYINKAFGTIQFIWGNLIKDSKYASYYNKCKPLFKEILNYQDWERRKALYDYYVDYDTLFGIANNFEDKCEEYYYKIKEKTSIYKYFEEKCLSDEYDCPDYYHKCNDKNPELALEKLPCHERIKARSAATSENSSTHHSPEQVIAPEAHP